MNRQPNTVNEMEVISHTAEIWRRIYEDCQRAKSSIDFEQYILCNDNNGRNFLSLMRDKAKEGIRVRLLLDRVGCRTLYNSAIIQDLRSVGARVYFYNPVTLFNLPFPKTWFPRSHIKISLIDSEVLYIGGACFADYMEHWRDLQARIVGPFVQNIPFGWEQFRRNHLPAEEAELRYLVTTRRRNPVYKELLQKINLAKNEIILGTPYFIPPRRLEKALAKAAARGVVVKILMSEFSDVPFITRVAQSYLPRMIRKGLKFYLFHKEIFHAKYMIIDDSWATFGSTNIDYISFFRNREANLVVQNARDVALLRQNAERDISESAELTADFGTISPGTHDGLG